jgi:hypothetical protein
VAVTQKRGIRFRRIQRKVVSTDPQRQAILSRLRVTLRHLPQNGVLLFFDVKLVAVKRYGGYRWTREARPVLPRQQKTRGFFYPFLLYDVRRGKVHWAFSPGKTPSTSVISCAMSDVGTRKRRFGSPLTRIARTRASHA